MSEATNQHRVFFPLERDENGWPPSDVEIMWCSRVGGDEYVIDNIPFFAEGIAVEDVVRAETQDGRLEFVETVREGAHATVRLIVIDEADVAWVREYFDGHRCFSELSADVPGLVALDIPPEVSISDLFGVLRAGHGDGTWEWEDGHVPDDRRPEPPTTSR